MNLRIVVDPKVSQNKHMIEIELEVGKYKFLFENNPSPSNPKTSWLATLSINLHYKSTIK